MKLTLATSRAARMASMARQEACVSSRLMDGRDHFGGLAAGRAAPLVGPRGSLRSPQSSASRAALSSMSQRVTIALANLVLRSLGKKNRRWVPRQTARQRLADSEILGLCDPRRPRDKNHLTIDQLSPRLIALLARSADSLPTTLTAGKNVAGFAPIGAAVGGASLVDPSDRGPERAWRFRAAAAEVLTEGGTLWTCRTWI